MDNKEMRQNFYFNMMEDEIETIKSDDIRRFALSLLYSIPEYFFTVPASSSGKYHPVNDLGEGGLVRHSITVKKMLEHLVTPNGFYDFSEWELDLLKVAALFHDSFKSGTQEEYEQNERTKFLHPLYAANHIVERSILQGFNFEDALFIATAIISHMGQWNTHKDEPGVLPLPVTPAQKVLHLADYLASRKDINMDLPKPDEENTIATDEKKESE